MYLDFIFFRGFFWLQNLNPSPEEKRECEGSSGFLEHTRKYICREADHFNFYFLAVIIINKFRCVIKLLRSMGGVPGLLNFDDLGHSPVLMEL